MKIRQLVIKPPKKGQFYQADFATFKKLCEYTGRDVDGDYIFEWDGGRRIFIPDDEFEKCIWDHQLTLVK